MNHQYLRKYCTVQWGMGKCETEEIQIRYRTLLSDRVFESKDFPGQHGFWLESLQIMCLVLQNGWILFELFKFRVVWPHKNWLISQNGSQIFDETLKNVNTPDMTSIFKQNWSAARWHDFLNRKRSVSRALEYLFIRILAIEFTFYAKWNHFGRFRDCNDMCAENFALVCLSLYVINIL